MGYMEWLNVNSLTPGQSREIEMAKINARVYTSVGDVGLGGMKLVDAIRDRAQKLLHQQSMAREAELQWITGATISEIIALALLPLIAVDPAFIVATLLPVVTAGVSIRQASRQRVTFP